MIKKSLLVFLILSVLLISLAGVSASDSDSLNPAMSSQIDTGESVSQESLDLDAADYSADLKAVDSSADSDISDGESLNEDASPLKSKPSSGILSSANLELDNDADKENVEVGDLVTWTLEAKNFGPDTAKNVKVLDKLPEGMKIISYSLTKGSFNPSTGIWKIGDLESGKKEFLTIVTKALTPGEKVNEANLTSDTEIENPDECSESEEINVASHASKVLAKSKADALPEAGNPILALLISLIALSCVNLKRD